MEIGESVAIAMERSLMCPMEHRQPAVVMSQPDIGVKDVEILKENLIAGKSTVLIDSDANGELIDNGLRPLVSEVPSPESEITKRHGELPIRIGDLDLPVSVAAHHLIPGKDSLPKSSLARYVWQSKGTIFGDIGYHVDGAENGVWLPTHGKLAKRMGKAATIRVPRPDDPSQLMHRSYRFMSTLSDEGGASFISAYTQLSMRLFNRQYHGSHKEYSDKVVEMLDAISVWIDRSSGDSCQECVKSKSPDGRLPPPHFLIFRLNALSARLRKWLVGPPAQWTSGLFVSDDAKQYKELEDAYQQHIASRANG